MDVINKIERNRAARAKAARAAPPTDLGRERRDRHDLSTLMQYIGDKSSSNNDQLLQALERIYSAILSSSAMKPAELEIEVTGRDSEGRIKQLRVTRPTMRDH